MITTFHMRAADALNPSSQGDTSAATALASKGVAELWNDYPDLWPETVRALYVSSARWTQRMRSHLPAQPQKGDYARLFQRYGYGVPDLAREIGRASCRERVCQYV